MVKMVRNGAVCEIFKVDKWYGLTLV